MKRIPRLRHNTTGSADLARTPKISTWTQQYMEYYQTKQTRKGGIHIKDVSIRFGEIFGQFSGKRWEIVGIGITHNKYLDTTVYGILRKIIGTFSGKITFQRCKYIRFGK